MRATNGTPNTKAMTPTTTPYSAAMPNCPRMKPPKESLRGDGDLVQERLATGGHQALAEAQEAALVGDHHDGDEDDGGALGEQDDAAAHDLLQQVGGARLELA